MEAGWETGSVDLYSAMREEFPNIMALIHAKRHRAEALTRGEMVLLLADSIMDTRFFASPHWAGRYGGVRHRPEPVPERSPSKVLVLQWPGAIGDAAMAVHMLAALRQRYKESEITFLSSRAGESISLLTSSVDGVLENPLDPYLQSMMAGRLPDLDTLIPDIANFTSLLKGNRYDLLVNLQVLPMSAVLARLCDARQTIGMTLNSTGAPIIQGNLWGAYLFAVSAGYLRESNPFHRTAIFRMMLDAEEKLGVDPVVRLEPAVQEKVQVFLDQQGVQDQDVLIGIHPTAGTSIRTWKGYGQLTRELVAEAHTKVILLGAVDEREQLETIVGGPGQGIILATHFDLHELAACLCGCDLVIANDSGPMHMACLLKRRVIALFGPTSCKEVGPWDTEFCVLQSSLCHGCYKGSCADPQHYCMDQIKARDVLDLTKALLRNDPLPEAGFSLLRCSSQEGSAKEPESKILQRMVVGVLEGKEAGNGDRFDLEAATAREAETACRSLKVAVAKALSSGTGDFKTAGVLHVNEPFLRTLVVLSEMRDSGADPGRTGGFYQSLIGNLETLGDRLRKAWNPRASAP